MPGSSIHDQIEQIEFTIGVGNTQSDAQNIRGTGIFGIATPSTVAGTTLKIETSLDQSTWLPVQDSSGVDISFTVAASKYIVVQVSTLPGLDYIRLVSSAAASGSAEVFTLFLRNL